MYTRSKIKCIKDHPHYLHGDERDYLADAVGECTVEPNYKCDCGSDIFKVSSWGGEYETVIICSACGEAGTVHSG